MSVVVHRVPTPDGHLAVHDHGGDGPTVVLVHGFPDTARLWDAVVPELAGFRVVAYDVRGAGASSAPARRAGYRMARLLGDLRTVAAWASPEAPVHLVGHDWGAIQAFAAGTDPGTRAALASVTAVSAPGLEVVRWWLADVRAAPTPRRVAAVVGQARRSWYVAAFQLPVVPELLVRAGVLHAATRRAGHVATASVADAVRGLELYRANRSAHRTSDTSSRWPSALPLEVLTGAADPFVSPAVFDPLRRRVAAEVTVLAGAGHWLPRTHPRIVAEAVRRAATR
ncbi:alpha/beta fold hydrolase [Nitriliruptoraceae bacterium ZYF776]|nr:alpha/beta fold hydrolase [Profundirhabdus halotolerans]